MKIMVMEFPICNVCLKNEILCSGCSKKMQESNIKDDEIRIYRGLNKLMRDEKHLKESKVRRVYSDKNFILIICDKESVSKLIGKNGIIIKKIEKKLGKQIRVVSDSLTFNDFVKEILFSSTILGINIVYIGDSVKYRVRLPASERVLLPLSAEAFSDIANSLYKTPAEIVFE